MITYGVCFFLGGFRLFLSIFLFETVYRLCGGEWIKTQDPQTNQQRKRKKKIGKKMECGDKSGRNRIVQNNIEYFFDKNIEMKDPSINDPQNGFKGLVQRKTITKNEVPLVDLIDLTTTNDELDEEMSRKVKRLHEFYVELGYSFSASFAEEALSQFHGDINSALEYMISTG